MSKVPRGTRSKSVTSWYDESPEGAMAGHFYEEIDDFCVDSKQLTGDRCGKEESDADDEDCLYKQPTSRPSPVPWDTDQHYDVPKCRLVKSTNEPANVYDVPKFWGVPDKGIYDVPRPRLSIGAPCIASDDHNETETHSKNEANNNDGGFLEPTPTKVNNDVGHRIVEQGAGETPKPFTWLQKSELTGLQDIRQMEGRETPPARHTERVCSKAGKISGYLGPDHTSDSFLFQAAHQASLDLGSECYAGEGSEDQSPPHSRPLTSKNGYKVKPSFLTHLPIPRGEFTKLSRSAAQLKKLSGSVLNILHLDDEQETSKARAWDPSRRVPIVTQFKNHTPVYKPACSLYFEGVPGVGKTTMLKHLKSVFGDLTVVFNEPMAFWTGVYENTLKRTSKLLKGRGGQTSGSADLLSCQMKFATPFRVAAARKRTFYSSENGPRPVAPLDCWILHDRHLIAATVVFPLLHLKNKLLSFSDFIQLLSTFNAEDGETIVWLKLNMAENLRRIKKRGRRYEASNEEYLKRVNWAYHAVYCAWLLTQYFTPEDIVRVCAGITTISTVCHHSPTPIIRSSVAEKLYKSSIFNVLKDVIHPFRADTVLLEVCLTFAKTLARLQFIIVDLSEFQDDLPGCWTEIYMQALKNPQIKSHFFDWNGLSKFQTDFDRDNKA
ncbi:ORF13 [callitrichine gammaherpesvirus 3]|uniref:ORF13 n=1 Tax=callitrichine gammaherpesvirus 3 TaxID=106331 RepID=Q993J7_9GAMA|nr:ORF13 [callitrichine gammaherpesvirus 3]AAK38221.1 ORF13 [callitrichine gammaherpesvirus 3]